MKLYLYAPIAIAGLTAAVGVSSIASSEFGLFKSGQSVVAILNNKDQSTRTMDAMRTVDYRDHSVDVDFDKDASETQYDFGKVASNTPMPAPEVTTEAVPAKCSELEAPRSVARHARRSTPRAPRAMRTLPLAPTATTAPTLTEYRLKDKNKDGFRFYVKTDAKTPVISLVGLPAPTPALSFSFDSKKFEARQRKIECQMAKKQAEQWRFLSKMDLKKLQSFAMASEFKAFDEKGNVHVIKIDPLQIAADAEKMGAEAPGEASEEVISSADSK